MLVGDQQRESILALSLSLFLSLSFIIRRCALRRWQPMGRARWLAGDK